MKVNKILNIDSTKYGINTNCIINFIEIEITDLSKTIIEIFHYVSNLSWINNLSIDWKKNAFETSSSKTIDKIEDNFINRRDDNITTEIGEYIVSVKGLQLLQQELKYTSLPLAELIKEQVSGNPGFDFYGVNLENIILFGEAKYNSNQNAYGIGLKQVLRFIKEKKDIEELIILHNFVDEESCNKCNKGLKGYVVSFSLHTNDTDDLLKNIFRNSSFKDIVNYSEIVLIGVKINA